jgi:hypothetical protein
MSIDSPELANGEQGVTENATSFRAVADHATLHGSLGTQQDDISLFGDLQPISDRTHGGALHLEPGIWINIPATTHPAAGPTVNYSQTVLLNFLGLSWPHVTVATLNKTF